MILRYAFEILNLHKVFATCLASNKAAIRSNEKNGLSVEATIKEKRFVDGHYEDVVYMGITRDAWARGLEGLDDGTPRIGGLAWSPGVLRAHVAVRGGSARLVHDEFGGEPHGFHRPGHEVRRGRAGATSRRSTSTASP